MTTPAIDDRTGGAALRLLSPVVVLLAALVAPPAQGQDFERFTARHDEINEMIWAGRMPEARQAVEELVDLAKTQFAEYPGTLITALQAKGRVYNASGLYDIGEQVSLEARRNETRRTCSTLVHRSFTPLRPRCCSISRSVRTLRRRPIARRC